MGASSESESEGEGVSSEDEVGEDNQSEGEVVVPKEDAEPIPGHSFHAATKINGEDLPVCIRLILNRFSRSEHWS